VPGCIARSRLATCGIYVDDKDKGPPRNNVYKYDAGILASGKTPARSISAWIRNERATRPEVKRPSQIGKVISWRPLNQSSGYCMKKTLERA